MAAAAALPINSRGIEGRLNSKGPRVTRATLRPNHRPEGDALFTTRNGVQTTTEDRGF